MFPDSNGASGNVLSTNGAGVLSWVSPSAATSVSAVAGNATTPSIHFSSDPDTGLFNSAANTIGIAAGTNHVVDISTTELKGTSASSASIYLGAPSAANPAYAFNGDTDTGWFNPAPDTLAAATNGTEKIRIASDGRVGIGTSNPNFGKLHVEGGDVYLDKNSNANGGYLTEANLDGIGLVGSGSRLATPDLFVTDGGSVGIGTTTPGARLEVIDDMVVSKSFNGFGAALKISNTNPGPAAYGSLMFENDVAAAAGQIFQLSDANVSVGSNALVMRTNVAGPLIFGTNSTTRMAISSTGNVGIGTTLPGSPLQVVSSSSNTDVIRATCAGGWCQNYIASGGVIADWGANSTTNLVYAGANTNHPYVLRTNSLERMRIDTSGNVGIGTSVPTASLEVQNPGTSGNIRVISSLAPAQTTGYIFQNLGKAQSNSNSAQIMYYHAGDGLTSNRFGIGFHGSSEYLSVLAGGDVGIGTTAPNGKLQVMGQIMATGAASHNVANSIRLDSSGSGASRISALGPNNATRGSFQIDLYSADGSVGASPFQISNAGNIGIGGSPTGAKLAVTGNLTVTSGSVIADGSTSRIVSGMPGTAGATGPVCYNGGGAFDACSSLKKFKTEIEPLEVGLDFLMQLNPVTYRLKGTNTHEMGFIAEDMYALDPRFAVISTDGNLAGVKYDKITSLLTKSVQELRHEKDREISSLKKELESKNSEIQMMKNYLCSKDPSAPFCK